MTLNEVMSIFNKPHHLVPEYEVVPVLHRMSKDEEMKENINELKIKVFNDDVNLYLNPTEGILASKNTPVWTVSSNPEAPEGLQYKQVPKAMDSVGIILQDVRTSSSILLTPTPDGQVHLNGVLNNIYVIKSLPRRILDHVLYGGRKLFEPLYKKNVTNNNDLAYTHHHVVYKMPSSDQKDFKITNPEDQEVKRNVPDIIYPEFLVVADYSIYHKILIFFNIIKIINIFLFDKDATPYLENNRFEVSFLDADRALRNMGDYFYRESRFPTDFYDIAIAMTNLDLCNMITDDYCEPSTLGYAYVAGACDRNATKQSSEAVGMIEDNGGFSGIIVTAHEVGHLIGARHDGNPKGARDCPANDGFIMTSGLTLDENGFECQNRAKCLYNEPVLGESVTRILPGTLMSLDDQCNKVFGTAACNKDTTACIRLDCEYPGIEGYCRATAPAAEGSSCGDGLICLNGKCVLEGILTKEKDNEKRKLLEKFLPKFNFQAIRKIPWINLLKSLKNKLKKKLFNFFFARNSSRDNKYECCRGKINSMNLYFF
ncbi:A disintegrin and metalloproteinase with thrombospondin motifs 1 [Trachymyrmex septentrionalis]|uniref:A disintegrin and metalloproteinase with thrombospondin motifs 1 n=1 Tax=Trachymyrmex septentrionalis TaxID=34720 RepID=A0A151JWX9_9HYME|nr:A disintegrin and metalloproteinase with thrombospondin motifs 1 [Trachymyrmex septentrionalis]